jgi:hypothetical protein
MIACPHATYWQAHPRGESSVAGLAKITPRFPCELVTAGFRAKVKCLAPVAEHFRGAAYANGGTAYRIFA